MRNLWKSFSVHSLISLPGQRRSPVSSILPRGRVHFRFCSKITKLWAYLFADDAALNGRWPRIRKLNMNLLDVWTECTSWLPMHTNMVNGLSSIQLVHSTLQGFLWAVSNVNVFFVEIPKTKATCIGVCMYTNILSIAHTIIKIDLYVHPNFEFNSWIIYLLWCLLI